MYFLGEGHGGLKKRVAAWKKEQEVTEPVPVHFLLQPLNLFESDDIAPFISAIAEVKPRAVVIDTRSRASAGANENASQDVGRIVANCDRIRHETGAMVLLVHHLGKSSGTDRGSNVVRCSADTLISGKWADDGGVIRTAKSRKMQSPSRTLRRAWNPSLSEMPQAAFFGSLRTAHHSARGLMRNISAP